MLSDLSNNPHKCLYRWRHPPIAAGAKRGEVTVSPESGDRTQWGDREWACRCLIFPGRRRCSLTDLTGASVHLFTYHWDKEIYICPTVL